LNLSNKIQAGLPFDAIDHLAACIRWGNDGGSAPISKSQYTRLRRHPRAKLDAVLSARLARLAHVWVLSVKAFGDEDAARSFLKAKHPLLQGRRPIEIVTWNEFGAAAVIDILERMQYGAYA
jgi:putative toxin-antitoxin system antitoxin component (TIGR02293 family)